MQKIEVHTKNPYNVYVGSNILKSAGNMCRAACPKALRAALISDTNVAPIYASPLKKALEEEGFSVVSYTVPAGEASKSTGTYVEILEFLASGFLTRSDIVLALGGGVIGDMAAFAAATYLRGIDIISIPTSLLSAVDSSVGGKTGVDLRAGKNLVGAFHQPRLVICDTQTLDTLPEDIYRDGAAEVIKYAVLRGGELYSHLEEKGLGFDKNFVIPCCIKIKRDLVEEDERDQGSRRLLNFGHTLAHAAELKSGFKLSHGRAVAAGMSHMMRAAAAAGLMDEGQAAEAIAMISRFGLPTHFEYSVEELFYAIKNDKKRLGSSIFLIVPYGVGDVSIEEMTLSEAKEFLRLGE